MIDQANDPTSTDDVDAFWMARALAEAERGRGAVEPNPMVGAVLVRDGRLIAVGHHGRFGGPHAEVEAIRRAGDLARGATLYVTLEPCCHHGKTPPCVDLVIASGVTRVVAAMRDPFPRVDGGGFRRLSESGIEVTSGLLENEAGDMNSPYLKRLKAGRPHVIAKWAMTIDGKLAARTGRSTWISGDRSRALVHEVRGRMDAVIVGITTALIDDPMLNARPPGPRVASRIVLDTSARLPTDSRLVRTAKEFPLIVAATVRADRDRTESLRSRGAEVLIVPESAAGRIDLGPFLDELGRRGMTNVLVEGGGAVLGAFLDAGEVDEVDIFIATRIEGGSHEYTPVRGRGVDSIAESVRLESVVTERIGDDLRVRGRIRPGEQRAPGLDLHGP